MENEESNKDKSIVLLGEIGSGKTTFLNLICETTLETEDDGESTVKELFKKKSAYGK